MTDWSTTYGASHTHSFSSLPIYTSGSVPSGTLIGTSDAAYVSHETLAAMQRYPQIPKQKEPEMSTLEKIRAERKEIRERERIERIYQGFDEAHLDQWPDGTVLVFTWTPESTEKVYCYAALWTNERWYVTGRESPNGLETEDFVAWLVGKDVHADELEARVP